MSWRRYRFETDVDDYRPVTWPPAGPYWCTATGDDFSIVVAYLPPDVELTEFWPDAANVDVTDETDIQYTERFPRPAWWSA